MNFWNFFQNFPKISFFEILKTKCNELSKLFALSFLILARREKTLILVFVLLIIVKCQLFKNKVVVWKPQNTCSNTCFKNRS